MKAWIMLSGLDWCKWTYYNVPCTRLRQATIDTVSGEQATWRSWRVPRCHSQDPLAHLPAKTRTWALANWLAMAKWSNPDEQRLRTGVNGEQRVGKSHARVKSVPHLTKFLSISIYYGKIWNMNLSDCKIILCNFYIFIYISVYCFNRFELPNAKEI